MKAVCSFLCDKFDVVLLPVKYFQKFIAIVVNIENSNYVIKVNVI